MIHGYRIIKGKSGRRWAVSQTDPTSKTIYCEIPGDHTGLAGDSVRFLLTNGTMATLKGPWISNPTSLYEDTGIVGTTDLCTKK